MITAALRYLKKIIYRGRMTVFPKSIGSNCSEEKTDTGRAARKASGSSGTLQITLYCKRGVNKRASCTPTTQ